MNPQHIVIIGGVAGGATAAARLRRENESIDITILERGPYVSFANCGLPYFIGGEISQREALLLQSPQGFWDRYRIKVKVHSEVQSINPQNKKIKLKGGEEMPYDKLILSQGAQPFVPDLKGWNSDVGFTLRDMKDMDRIHNYIVEKKPKNAVVVGGGFIGIEMAEALVHRGLSVTLVEKATHVMPLMDIEFAELIQQTLIQKGIRLQLGTSLTEVQTTQVQVENGEWIPSEMVLMSIGVRPELSLARETGLKIGSSGGVLVNEFMETSQKDIYAVGDMAEIPHRISGQMVRIPLAGPANRQGRIVAHNVMAHNEKDKISYHGAMGTAVVKIFDKTAAQVGFSEESLKKMKLPHQSITVHPRNHAGYYPNAKRLSLKIVYHPETGLIWGAQSFGDEGVEKRIDVIATAIFAKMKVEDFQELDLSYAPPYSSANDPVNMAGFVASNQRNGFSPALSALEFIEISHSKSTPDKKNSLFVIDVRDPSEVKRGSWPGSINIPVNQLRSNLEKIPKEQDIYVYCAVGFRGHLATRILLQNGFASVKNISGGFTSIELIQKSHR